MPLGRWCLIAWPLAYLPSMLLLAAVLMAWLSAGSGLTGITPARLPSGFEGFTRVVLLAPMRETLILAAGLWLLTGRVKSHALAALISAVLWGIAHGLNSWPWFFGVVWNFFIFSCAWLTWSRAALWKGFVAAAVPHCLINFTVMILRSLQG